MKQIDNGPETPVVVVNVQESKIRIDIPCALLVDIHRDNVPTAWELSKEEPDEQPLHSAQQVSTEPGRGYAGN